MLSDFHIQRFTREYRRAQRHRAAAPHSHFFVQVRRSALIGGPITAVPATIDGLSFMVNDEIVENVDRLQLLTIN